MEDPWDKKYVLALSKGIFVDIILIFLFVMTYVLYNITVNETIVLPMDILSNMIFQINNFIVLLILITYFIYRSRQII